MEYVQKTEMATYVNRVAPLETFQLPYDGAKIIQVPQGEWSADQFKCLFTCVDKENGSLEKANYYSEARFAYEVEKKDSSQMFFYGAAPKNISPMSRDCEDMTTPIRELMQPITEACGIYFDGGSSPICGDDHSKPWIETHGGCDHATLGKGEWKATIETGDECSHILLSISFFGLSNDPFFEQVQKGYLNTYKGEI